MSENAKSSIIVTIDIFSLGLNEKLAVRFLHGSDHIYMFLLTIHRPSKCDIL